MYNKIMSEEQKKLIKRLRDQTVRVNISDTKQPRTPINKSEAWQKAKKAGNTISDDNLFPNNNARP